MIQIERKKHGRSGRSLDLSIHGGKTTTPALDFFSIIIIIIIIISIKYVHYNNNNNKTIIMLKFLEMRKCA